MSAPPNRRYTVEPQGHRGRGRPSNIWRRYPEKETWTAGYKYSWTKMEAAAQDRAWRGQVVCGLCSTWERQAISHVKQTHIEGAAKMTQYLIMWVLDNAWKSLLEILYELFSRILTINVLFCPKLITLRIRNWHSVKSEFCCCTSLRDIILSEQLLSNLLQKTGGWAP